MLRSLYLSATHMLVQRRKVDVITNNIANMDTAGYKADKLVSRSFKDMLLVQTGKPAAFGSVGPLNTGVHIDELITSFKEGSLEPTGRTLDLAIAGDGFFAVSTLAGERYTRNGAFTLNSEGFLVTADGNRVLGTAGFIQLDSPEFSIDELGNVINAEGETAGSLKLVHFEDKAGLSKLGDGLFINRSNQAAQAADGAKVFQGFLETSNTEAANEVFELMAASRTYETSQRVIRMLDDSLAKAVNEIGRV
ncbi:MAG: Flagellar basal-body rod protein FlgG [Firmicutes bacterium ADurb.Bin356]|nr:MAG: Flagellar basal-body rod protein FlgG [Firmicutes bacterium ADurb.Bin356]